MRLRFRFICALAGCLLLPALLGAQQETAAPAVKQDPDVLRFVQRLEVWYPDSTFKVTKDEQHQTASGPYRLIEVERTCSLKFLSGTTAIILDEVTGMAWMGPVAALPTDQMGPGLTGLKPFVEQFLPDVLARNLNMQATLSWSLPDQRAGALIPFQLAVSSGYGRYDRPGAVAADGQFLVLGSPFPFDQDPVAYRKQLLDASPLVMWDHPGTKPKVEIVEFSDFECPGCRAKWPVIKKVLNAEGGEVRHGMVNFPLTAIHPWSFRAASAGWCVAKQNPLMLVPIKEQFYSMQRDMEVDQVEPAASDFVAGHDLDEKAFAECFLKPVSLQAVNEQLGLGNLLMVNATPTYFVNGWKVQAPDEGWFTDLVKRLVKGDDP